MPHFFSTKALIFAARRHIAGHARARPAGHTGKQTAARTRETPADTQQTFSTRGSNVLCDGVDYSLLVRL